MWDYKGLSAELSQAGYVNIRRAMFGDSRYEEFKAVEEPGRWEGCLGFECEKPV
ncbi:hypothetical protein Thiowin_04534 [Thiorhodovibrio winogradskyi]|uniref:Uncharacterized protein n=2 Tax=Thiorhodovibrio winogradskyi TaxID=77007 RepID=A0ABZ0SFH4_9GAMM